MSDYDLKKEQAAQIPERLQRELRMQKYSCYAQELSCILQIDKKVLNEVSGNLKSKMMEDRLSFIEKIDIFKSLSLSSKLSIVNKLVSRKYRLGQKILNAGEVPSGLFIVKQGYCKAGVVVYRPYEVSGADLAWYRPKVEDFRYADQMKDPIRGDKVQERE